MPPIYKYLSIQAAIATETPVMIQLPHKARAKASCHYW